MATTDQPKVVHIAFKESGLPRVILADLSTPLMAVTGTFEVDKATWRIKTHLIFPRNRDRGMQMRTTILVDEGCVASVTEVG